MRRLTPIVVAAAVALASPLAAFDFIVTRYDDPLPDGCLAADCSLREAVIAANAASDADRILLSAGVYSLTLVGSIEDLAATGDLDIKRDAEILGVGAGITILDAAGLGEHAIAAGALGPSLIFALRGVTVRNSDGSGILLGVGTHTVEGCEFRDNGSSASHHGILTTIESIVTLRGVSSIGNSGNGLSAQQSSVTVENSTFSGNGAREVLVNLGVSFSCSHCTIVDPTDIDSEVSVFGNSTLVFSNSIVAGDCFLTAGSAITSLGGNVESAGNSCNFIQPTDLNTKTSVELDLAVLADNGGSTRTHLPGAASVASGNADDALCLLDDQRGVVRETNCESGAVERTNSAVPTPIFIDGFQQGDPEAWSATVGAP